MTVPTSGDDVPTWSYYCRVCGASRESLDEINRDVQAIAHLAVCSGGFKEHVEVKVQGRLMHIWSW